MTLRNGQAGAQAANDEIDLGALSRAVWAKRKWIWVPTLASVAVMFAYLSVVAPRYTGEAKILLDNQESYLTRPDRAVGDAVGAPDPEAVQSQIQLLTSRDLARDVGRKIGLPGNAEFDPVAAGFDPISRVMILLGMQRDPFKMSPEERVLDKYYERLSVFPVPRTRVLAVEFTSKDADLAARGANAIAETFIAMRAGAKKDDARQAGSWLAGNIEDLRRKVAEAEAHVEAFRAQTGLLGVANNQTVSSQQLSDMNAQMAAARSAQSDAQSKAKIIRDLIRQGRAFEAPDIARDDLVRRISEQRVTLKGQLALESRTLLPGHPRIKELQAQIVDLENELRNAADKAARTLENEARLAGARVEGLAAALDAQKKTVAVGNEDEVQLRALEREAKSARDQLESYLAKHREATARDNSGATPADARVISRAVAPQLPSFPKRVPLLLIAFLAGFILSLSVVVARELLAGAARPQRNDPAPDAEDGPPAPLLRESELQAVADAPAPVQPAAPPRGHDRHWILSREIQPTIEDLCLSAPGCVVAFLATGASADDAMLRVARHIAGRRSVILVQCDADSTRAGAGLSDVQAGAAGFADAIQRDQSSRLHVLPAGAGEIEAEALTEIVNALAAVYDCVILSAPALSASSLGAAIAPLADVVFLAPGADASQSRLMRAALAELDKAGARDVRLVQSAGGLADLARAAA